MPDVVTTLLSIKNMHYKLPAPAELRCLQMHNGVPQKQARLSNHVIQYWWVHTKPELLLLHTQEGRCMIHLTRFPAGLLLFLSPASSMQAVTADA